MYFMFRRHVEIFPYFMSEKTNLAIKMNSINSISLLHFHQNKNSLSVQKKIKLDIP